MSADERFDRIDKDLKNVLQRFTHSDYIKELESVMIDFCVQSEPNAEIASLPLAVVIPDGYLRMTCHGVAQYYSLFTRSVDFNGKRVTLISKPRLYRGPHVRMPPLNCARLSDYITQRFSSSEFSDLKLEKVQEEYFTVVTSTDFRKRLTESLRARNSDKKKKYRRRREQQVRYRHHRAAKA